MAEIGVGGGTPRRTQLEPSFSADFASSIELISVRRRKWQCFSPIIRKSG